MMAEPRRRTGRVMCVFATLSSGQRGRKAVRWVGKCVNEVKAVWMPEWQNGREREERKETDREKIKKDMWAWRAARGQLFHHAAGEEKAKNTLQLFSTKGGSEKRRECKIGRRKKRAFPSPPPPHSPPAWGCPSLASIFFSCCCFSPQKPEQAAVLLHIVWLGWGIEFLPVVRAVWENTWERAMRHKNSDQVLLNEVKAAPRDRVWKRKILMVIFQNLALCHQPV